jgi:cell volume regulation protein A
LLGVVASIISVKLKIPQLLLLILIGVALGQMKLVSFQESFLVSFGIFALIMIMFDSTSKFKLSDVGTMYPKALKLALIFLLTNIIFFTLFTHLIFDGQLTWTSVLISLLFSSMMSGTDPGAVLSIFAENKEVKVAKLLEFESIINTPITVIFPLIILFWFEGSLHAGDIFVFFIRGVMAGIGTGFVLGIISFRLMRKEYLETISPLLIVALALISYTLAEYIGGNGVLSVTALGIIFGWAVITHKSHLKKFVKIFTNFLTIVVFILLGLLIKLPHDKYFLLNSIILFVIYIGLRFVSVSLAFRKEISLKERLFMSLNVSKGVAVAVIAFIILAKLTTPGLLSAADVASLNMILELSFLFILYSVVLSTITIRFSRFFIPENV